MATAGFHEHDHGSCVSGAMEAAERHCAAQGLQFTPVRRRALEILLVEHKALGAYDVLAHLAEDGFGKQPPVAYRALDFLVSNGFAHKIEHLNAYIACAHPGADHLPAFMICRACDMVAETVARGVEFAPEVRKAGFAVEAMVIEAKGLCPSCQKSGAAP